MIRARVVTSLPLALALALAACGGSRTPSRSSVQRDPAPDAGVTVTAPRPLACAATYAELSGACDPTVSNQMCSYAEGTCYCGIAYQCSGVRIPDEELAALPNEWQCTPTPPAIRPDGCPGVQPSNSACTTEGKVCSWGDCCFTQMTCVKGTWQVTGGGCPP